MEKEPIKLAPSSSQVPALLAKTKQNIFDVRAQQQAAQRYQQRFQQRPGSGANASQDTGMGDSLRQGSQVSAPGAPSLLQTASGINLAGDQSQDAAQPGPSSLPLYSTVLELYLQCKCYWYEQQASTSVWWVPLESLQQTYTHLAIHTTHILQ